MRVKTLCTGAVALLLLGATTLDAQCRRGDHRCRAAHSAAGAMVEFGVRGGYDFEVDGGMAGAQVRIPLVRQFMLVPSADVFFDDAVAEWQVNADAVVRPDGLGGLYGGAGVAFVNGDFDGDGDSGTEVGYNLLLGLDGGRVASTTLRPFVEGRWTDVESFDPFRLVVGVNVPITGFGRR